MNKRKPFSPGVPGASSLLVIFAVLCLLVLAMLSLRSVQVQQRLSQAAAQATSDYYRADLQAQAIFARLRQGEIPEGVERDGDVYRFCCPISQNQTLHAALRRSGENWTVLRWQAVATSPEANAFLPVWDGSAPG